MRHASVARYPVGDTHARLYLSVIHGGCLHGECGSVSPLPHAISLCSFCCVVSLLVCTTTTTTTVVAWWLLLYLTALPHTLRCIAVCTTTTTAVVVVVAWWVLYLTARSFTIKQYEYTTKALRCLSPEHSLLKRVSTVVVAVVLCFCYVCLQ